MPNAIQLAEATAAASARLRAGDRTIEQSVNFTEIYHEIAAMEKGRISPEMSWLNSDLTSSNAFYVVVRNKEGVIVAVCAVRNYQLYDENLKSFLERQYARLYGRGEGAIDTSLVPPIVDKIKGNVCYMGDFFIAREGRVSNQFNNSDFILLVYGLSMMQFDPDWVFGFVKQQNAIRGLPAIYLAARCYPFAIEWKIKVDHRVDSDWIVGLDREDLQYVFNLAARGRFSNLNSIGLVEKTSGSPELQPSSEPEVKVAHK